MNEDFDNRLILDLIEIERKKKKIKETLGFTQAAYNTNFIKGKRRMVLRWILTTSSVAAILILGLTVVPSFLTLNGQEQFDRYYKLFNASTATRDIDPGNTMATLYKLYESKQLVQAQIYKDSLLVNQPDNPRIILLSALIHTDLGQWDKAINEFEITSKMGGSYQLYSRWYLALIFLRNHNYEQCGEQLAILKKMKRNPFMTEVNTIHRKIRFRKN
jgi:hypothetical protein